MLQNTTTTLTSGGPAMSKPHRGLPILRPLLCLLLVSLGLLTSPTVFAHRPIYTDTYTLGSTPPTQSQQTVAVANLSGSFILTLQNGTTNGSQRISSGTIELNGTVILGPTQLTSQASTLQVAVTLQASNTLKVTLNSGATNAFVVISLLQHLTDTTPPTLTLTQPSSGQVFTASPITVSGTATDNLSGIKDFWVNGVLTPLVNGTFTAQLSLTSGSNRVSIYAKDYEGNLGTTYSDVFLDSVPPTVNIQSPASGALVTTPTLSVSAVAYDDVGVPTVTINGQPAVRNGDLVSATVTLTPGVNTITIIATDGVGRQTTVTRSVTYDAPLQVSITNPLPGAVLDSDTTLVSGTFNGPPNTGVTVNGVVAETSGTNFYANNVPLLAGANTLTATATTDSGATATQSITITSTGKAAIFQVTAEPQSGIAPLKVKFTVTPNTTVAIAKIEADYDGNGVIDFTTSDPNAPIEYTYTTPGVYQAKLIITDNQNLSHTQTLVIVVYDAVQMDQKFTAIWSGMNDALIAKDVTKALSYLNAQAKTKYGPVFNALLSNMPEIIASYSPLQRVSISSDIGEYAINRTVDGVNRIFFIYFLRDPDGVWRIDAM